jgi:hypothetical protein
VGVLLWIARILILLIVIRLLLRLVFGTAFARRAAPRQMRERSGGALVQDPVCGTYIPKTGAFMSGRGADVK